jgi:hypothetical protein
MSYYITLIVSMKIGDGIFAALALVSSYANAAEFTVLRGVA